MKYSALQLLLILWPLPFALFMFFRGGISMMKAAMTYYTADIALTGLERKHLSSRAIFSGPLPEPPAYFSDAQKAAYQYFPMLRTATHHMLWGMFAVVAFVVYVAIMSNFLAIQ